MAKRNIALEVTLGGVTQAVTDLKDFEEVLKSANELLAQLDKGSEAFQKLSTELDVASKKFEALKKTSDPKFYEKAFKDFAKVGAGITSSFAAAQAAINLFGGDATRVSEAAAEAQNLLTLALSARGAAEAITSVRSAANTVATLAEAAAANTASVATQKFYSILAKNPYGALVVAVGAVLGVLSLLIQRTDEAAKKQEELLLAVEKSAGTEQAKLRTLKAAIEDETASRQSRLDAIEELQKMFPDYFANLDEEKILAGDLTIDYNKLSDAIVRKARAEALSQEVGRLSVERLRLEREQLAATNERIAAEENLINVSNNASKLGQGAAAALQAASTRSAAAKVREAEAIKAVSDNLDEENRYIAEINKNTQENTGITTNNTEETKDNADAQNLLIQAYQNRLAVQIALLDSLQSLNETEGFGSVELLDRAKKLFQEAQQLAKERSDFFTTEQEKFVGDLDRLLFEAIPDANEIKTLQDIYGEVFFGALEQVKQGGVLLTDEAGRISQGWIKQLIPEDADFSPQQEAAFISFFTRFAAFIKELSAGVTVADINLGFGSPEQVEGNLLNLIERTKKILNDPSVLPGLRESEIAKAAQEIFNIPTKQQQDFITAIDKTGEIGYQSWLKGISSLTDKLVQFGLVQSKQVEETTQNAEAIFDISQQLLAVRNQFGDVTETGFFGVQDDLRLTTGEIENVIDNITAKLKTQPALLDALIKDIGAKSTLYLRRFGADGMQMLFQGISDGLGNLEGKSREQLEQLRDSLSRTREFIRLQFGEPVAMVFDQLINNVIGKLQELPTEAELAAQKAAKAIIDVIQTFQSVLNVAQQTFNLAFEAQADILEKRYKRITEGIVGDSEEANKKRLEAEKTFQNQRAELEKRQAKLSLRIALTQALANTAEAITKTYAALGGSPFAVLAAGAVAALNGAQVAIIAQQLNQIDKYQKGGRLRKGQGGLLVGPAHEQGGIKFQNGGVELEGGESVINRVSTVKYQELLNQINIAGGGRPIIQNNFDDSRIVEALIKQRTQPIRAFVVESDITAKQETRRRLEELSQI